MLLTPRYGDSPVLHLDGDQAAIGAIMIEQRRSLGRSLSELTADDWQHPSRCEGWTTQDVVAHLSSTNGFWTGSIHAGCAGEPTRFLASFDPVATPALLAEANTETAAETLDAYLQTTESFAARIADLDEADWSLLAESPAGHVSINAVAHHALWDAWIHERDIFVPLGQAPDEVAAEVSACLRHVASFTPALSLNNGATDVGAFGVRATDPDVSFSVVINDSVRLSDSEPSDAFVLTGDAVELVEALSFRAPMTHEIPDHLTWAFSGLGVVFDQ